MRVYIRIDEANRITALNSEIFISDFSGWITVDEGDGDKYAHAQGNYLPKPLYDKFGRHNFRYEDGRIIEIPDEEKTDVPAPEKNTPQEEINLDLDFRIACLELGI